MREVAFWWWGEDEAPGLAGWIERARDEFERETGVHVSLRLLRHDEVMSAFREAAERRQGPDLQFFWNGIYHVDFVWRGLVRPLDDLISPEDLAAFGGGAQSRVVGLTYRVGWYVIPVVWVVNQDVLDLAGVAGLPADWEGFLEACARVRAAGLEPVTVGDGEGDFSVWWLTHFLTQGLGEPGDVARLVLGELDWRERRYADHWRLLAELRRAGYLDEEALPTTLWTGLERFNEGRSAFTLASGPMFAGCRRALGDAATVMVAPRAADGPLAGVPVLDTQGIGIRAGSNAAAEAATFLRFVNEPARLESLWQQVRLFPANRRWQGPGPAADTDYSRMWDWYARGPSTAYVPNLLPIELHFELAAALGRSVLAGDLESEAASAAANDRCARWVRAHESLVPRYRAWATSAATAAAPTGQTNGSPSCKESPNASA